MVFDLRALLSSDPAYAKPERIGSYAVSDQQVVTNLKFSDDGTSIVTTVKEGQFAQVFRLAPKPKATRVSSYHVTVQDDRHAKPDLSHQYSVPDRDDIEKPQQTPLYTLRRGRTPGVIEGIDWLSDGRWFAMGTRKRTIHVFALNPYGGPVDEATHLLGKVFNAAELVSLHC